ncbi:tannase/feruloyl esterase family alpha/beta hydrolase [Marinomonas sp. IMCC 4694]|uniref:tannase/feruloyl esterase family alpha/beta hydrolase n=1 Tax=Marinomonas sp. IMCC 4694 TaxID=2605432 RepID=UPI0011E6FC08|nr:tannase/feruloyl esterase family alpha/beta hydrolase [Marinomonas sp. IMCC 4694]TYL48261.1 tannase/feruloyl esterase family alpha/beta hydrolase [Marinomonas sp. IMCC 4694]
MRCFLIPRSLMSVAIAGLTLSASAPHLAAALPQLQEASPSVLPSRCEDLPSLMFPNTVIASVETIANGTLTQGNQNIGEHCLVKGGMNQRISQSDGKSYAIGFEMRLPKQWNGRFLHQGNGGLDGVVKTAEGAMGGGPITSALMQGFAVISSDAGHDRGLPTFAYDPQARLDYGYQAVATLTPMAKSMINQAYGRGPDRSYFAGCSNGGRHAMVAAARYADDYDGILVGAPGYRLPLAAVASIAGAKVYASIPDTDKNELSSAFTPAERRHVSQAILAKCDELDGAKDGMIQNVKACQATFSLQKDVATCDSDRDGHCLSQPQKNAIERIFNGVTTSDGKVFYSPFPYDVGISSKDHMMWEYSAPIQRDSGAVAMIFNTPPVPLEDFNIRHFNGAEFVWKANIDELVSKVYATNGEYDESAMAFMSPPSPEDLSTLRDKGGKVMVYHGVSDAIFSVQDTETWFNALDANNHGHADEFAQFYPIPGMGHCRGGQSTDQFDMLSPLVAWVEKGEKPEQVIATARGLGNEGEVNEEIPASWNAARTRPLCPYPKVAFYKGEGNIDVADSFMCERPAHAM